MPDSSITLQGDYNYQPDPAYTDPMGAVVTSDTSYDPLEIQKMRAALEAKNKPQQMSIGEMASNLYGNLQDYEKKLGITDMKRLLGQIPAVKAVAPVAQVPLALASSFPAALAYGYVKPGSSPEAYQQAQARSDALQYQPENPYSQQMLGDIGSAFEAAKIPPYIGHLPPARLSPSDVQVMGARGINAAREFRDIPQDFTNAKSRLKAMGPTGEPTYGVKLQQMADELGDYAARQKAQGRPIVSILGAENLMPETKLHAMPIGEKSMLWDEARKSMAEEMEAKGRTPQEIFAKTLTTRGLDPQHWEQFIPSDSARVLANLSFKDKKDLVLSDILHYPQLYEAYPWLENYKVAFAGMGKNNLGEHDHWKRRITFNNSILDDPKQAADIIAHEPVHAIQYHENWPKGGSTEQFPSGPTLSVASSIHDLMNDDEYPMSLDHAIEFTKLHADEPVTDQQVKDAVRLVQHGQANIVDVPDPYSWYHHLSGEQQAWLPSKLWGKNESQLKQIYPYSKDVMGMDPNKTILRKGKMPSGEATYVTSGQLHQQLRNKQAPTLAQMKAELQVNNEQPTKEMATKPKGTVDLSKRKLFGLDLNPKQDQLPAVVKPATPTSTELTAPTTSSEALNAITPADYAVEAIKNMPVSRRTLLKTPVNAAISHMGRGLIGDTVKGLIENPVKAVSGMLKKKAMKHALEHLETVFGDYSHPLMDGPNEKWDPKDLAAVHTDLSHEALSRLNDVPAEHYAEHFTEDQLQDAYHKGAKAWGGLWGKDSGLMQEAANDAVREAISEIGVDADEYDLIEAAYPHFRKEMQYIVSQGHPKNVTGELSSAFARSLIDMHHATAEAEGTTYLSNAASKAVSDFYNEQYNTLIKRIIDDEEGGGSSVSHIEGMVGAALQELQKNLPREKFQEIHQLYKQLKTLPQDALNADLDSNPTAVKLKKDFLSVLDEMPIEDKTWFPFQALNYPASLLEQYENVMGVNANKTSIDEVERGLRQFAEKTGQEYEPFNKYYLQFRLEHETRPKEIKNIQNRLKSIDGNEQPTKEMAIKNPGGNWSDKGLNYALKPFKQGLTLATDTNRYTLRPNWEEIADEIGYPEDMKQQMLITHTLNQWVDKRLKSYIKNDMGTPKDPVRDLADQGITHIQDLGERFADLNARGKEQVEVLSDLREERGHPREGYAKTNAGKDWEVKTDWGFDPHSLKHPMDNMLQGDRPSKEEWPGLLKALERDPEAELNRYISLNSFGFDHLTDELRNAVDPTIDLPQHLKLSPKDLERMTVPDAVRLVSKINKYRADLAEKATVKNLGEFRQNFPALKTYDNGMAWHELKEPVYQPNDPLPEGFYVMKFDRYDSDLRTGKDIKREIYQVVHGNGIDMDRYTDEMKTPEEAIADYHRLKYRDTLDKALKEEGELMGHCVGGYTDDVVNGFSRIFTLRDAKGRPHVTIETIPSKGFEEDYSLRDSHHDVAQIKGKGNKEVSPKYRAEVLDFLNNAYPHSALVDVEDLRNIDAVDMENPGYDFATPTIRDSFIRKAKQVKREHPDLPRFIDNSTFRILYEGLEPPEGHKDGGYIQKFQVGGAVSSEPIESPPQFGVLPNTFPSIKGDDAELIRQRLANAPAMNLANENYTKGLNTINVRTPEDQDYANSIPFSQVGGYYDTKKGNEIVINPVLSNINNYKTLPHVVGHEAQHLQDIESLKGNQNVLDKLRMRSLQRQIENNFQRVKEKYPEYADLGVGYYNLENVPFSERLADLAGYEAILPKGTRLVDTPFGKEVFSTPALQNYYHASVRPMEQKMMPQTPSVMERNPVITTIRDIKNFIQPKLDTFGAKINEGKSYADAAYETVLNKKDGGSIKSLDHDRMKFELMMRGKHG